jgi:hypothetical protein
VIGEHHWWGNEKSKILRRNLVWIQRGKVLTCTKSTLLDTVLQLLGFHFPCSNKTFKIRKNFSKNLIDFSIETGSLGDVSKQIVNLVKLTENLFKIFFGSFITFVLFVQGS